MVKSLALGNVKHPRNNLPGDFYFPGVSRENEHKVQHQWFFSLSFYKQTNMKRKWQLLMLIKRFAHFPIYLNPLQSSRVKHEIEKNT